MDLLNLLKKCQLCPRQCGINRIEGYTGFCGAGYNIKAAKSMLHMWEEPCISGDKGAGAVFFSSCSMRCVFCQNHEISQKHYGREISINRLAEIFIELQYRGANNIDLVSPTHYVPQIAEALSIARSKGLKLPVIYNTNGYECIDTLRLLEGFVDVYLPDIKYFRDEYSKKYSGTPDYFKYASRAVLEMYRQVGIPKFENGIIKRGLIIRHMLLPGLLSDSKKVLDWISKNLPKDIYISLMSQYVPMYHASNFVEINKRVSEKSYEWLIDYSLSLGLENGYIQEQTSAEAGYTPLFDCSGI